MQVRAVRLETCSHAHGHHIGAVERALKLRAMLAVFRKRQMRIRMRITSPGFQPYETERIASE